jgi:hypothetical protein
MERVSAEGGLTNQPPLESRVGTSEVWERADEKLANDELSCRCTPPLPPSYRSSLYYKSSGKLYVMVMFLDQITHRKIPQ